MKTLQIHELGPLFEEVQLKNVLGDGKTFLDCVPKRPLDELDGDYLRERNDSGFDLKKFIETNFSLPKVYSAGYQSDARKSPMEHIDALWDVLTRQPDDQKGSLIPLPFPYVVPGGRFREIYYWDSYFTMLGLKVSGRYDLIQHMVDNFAYLIDQVGYIPNGNRSYFLGRSQPPFFSLMVRLLAGKKGREVLQKYLPQLEKEYQFWMRGADLLTVATQAVHRAVRMQDGTILNRYWDENSSPRPEAYKEDLELSHNSKGNPVEIFRHLRAAAESGWDFSSRWFRDANSFSTIHTTDIVPVDLNCLIFHLEQTLAEAYQMSGNMTKSSYYLSMSAQRRASVIEYCWSRERKFFFDFDFIEQKQKQHYTLAAAFPLFFEIASPDQATFVQETLLQKKFLKPGGLTTTLAHTGQQWDAPNGWAPLQWIAYKGLLNYGFDDTAKHIKTNWTNAILKVYQETGKMTEKYDVWHEAGEASGGEYPNQDGFGWTNGVFLAMME